MKQYQSNSIKKLATALSKAQAEMQHAKKAEDNPFFKSKYADLPAVIDVARPLLAKNGLSVSQMTDVDENGKITLITQLMHSSGEWIRGYYPVNPVKTDPQAIGSAITYARRYSFCAVIGVAATGEDDDGNAASGHKPDGVVDTEQAATIDTLLNSTGSDRAAFLKYFGADDVRSLKAKDYHSALAMLNKKAGKA